MHLSKCETQQMAQQAQASSYTNTIHSPRDCQLPSTGGRGRDPRKGVCQRFFFFFLSPPCAFAPEPRQLDPRKPIPTQDTEHPTSKKPVVLTKTPRHPFGAPFACDWLTTGGGWHPNTHACQRRHNNQKRMIHGETRFSARHACTCTTLSLSLCTTQ